MAFGLTDFRLSPLIKNVHFCGIGTGSKGFEYLDFLLNFLNNLNANGTLTARITSHKHGLQLPVQYPTLYIKIFQSPEIEIQKLVENGPSDPFNTERPTGSSPISRSYFVPF